MSNFIAYFNGSVPDIFFHVRKDRVMIYAWNDLVGKFMEKKITRSDMVDIILRDRKKDSRIKLWKE